MTIKFSNKEVYNSSKATVPETLSGEFNVTNIVRNGRTQIIDTLTLFKYWIDSTTLNDIVSNKDNPESKIEISADAVKLNYEVESTPSKVDTVGKNTKKIKELSG